jgi:hypothetical protein
VSEKTGQAHCWQDRAAALIGRVFPSPFKIRRPICNLDATLLKRQHLKQPSSPPSPSPFFLLTSDSQHLNLFPTSVIPSASTTRPRRLPFIAHPDSRIGPRWLQAHCRLFICILRDRAAQPVARSLTIATRFPRRRCRCRCVLPVLARTHRQRSKSISLSHQLSVARFPR